MFQQIHHLQRLISIKQQSNNKMYKLLCLVAIIAVVAALPTEVEEAPNDGFRRVEREVVDAPDVITENKETEPLAESAVEAQDDMDKAETFGFGYHRKIIHVYPSYYPRYYYGGYYPRYYYGHYGHYW
uniref:Uncharacterized protein n=1 Tax=Anopheles farauti TaxID=69004 RepID=A0A182QZW5_9DIPT